jgi:LPXTG-motif cell wall-anchored protein
MPEVHVGGVVLLKVDADGKPIIAKDNSGKNIPNGARFGIYETEADAKAGKNLIMEAAADKDGYVKFFGLAYGNKGDNTANSSKEYWVVELDAPTGYNKLNAPFKVTVTATTHDVSFAQKVVNHKFDLPHTGGTGTALLVIGGSAMAAVSIALIVMMRRRDKKAAADKASQA